MALLPRECILYGNASSYEPASFSLLLGCDRDIAFVFDTSSFDNRDLLWAQIKDLVRNTWSRLNFQAGSADADLVALVNFDGSGAYLVSPLSDQTNDLNTRLNGINIFTNGMVNFDVAIRQVLDQTVFITSVPGLNRVNAPDVVIIITNNTLVFRNQATELSRWGYKMIVVGIGNGVNQQQLTTVASSSNDVIFVSTASLGTGISSLVTQVIGRLGNVCMQPIGGFSEAGNI